MEGKDSPAELTFFRPIESVQHTNLIEEEGEPVAGEGQVLRLPSKPYSIDTVKLTRKLPPRKVLTLPYRDTMEYQDQQEAESVWKRYSSYRDLTLTSEQNHTPGGTQSLKSGGLLDFAYVRLPAMTNVSLEVWIYDSGEPDTFGAVIAAPSSPSDPTGSAEFGIFPTRAAGRTQRRIDPLQLLHGHRRLGAAELWHPEEQGVAQGHVSVHAGGRVHPLR